MGSRAAGLGEPGPAAGDGQDVGIFPNRAAIIRLVGAVLAEQTDEWTEQRRYMGLELLAKAQQATIDSQPNKEVPQPHTAAIAA